MNTSKSTRKVLLVAIAAAVMGFVVAASGVLTADPSKADPPKTNSDGDKPKEQSVYYPGTEKLAPDEMRIIACGTGTPQPRLKQAAACFLVQLGNGDNFIFDLGAGSQERLASLNIPYDHLDKVFIGHLHMDHMGDLPVFWYSGPVNGRLTRLRVWGPSGVKPEWGTKAAMGFIQKMYAWDEASRGALDLRGLELEVNEFDWTVVNKVIYNEKGVIVRSLPAIHNDQSASFILEWKGLKFAFSSDTKPNKWWVEHTQGVDVAVHECFAPPDLMLEVGFTPEEALFVSTVMHTPPQAFGKVMALTRPRRAVAYHFPNDFNTAPLMLEAIRDYYDGPLDLAADFMVWNVTKKEIRTRMAVVSPEHLALPPLKKKLPPDPARVYKATELTRSGGEPSVGPVMQKVYDDFNKKHGTKFKP
jgi:ribonuclease Z